MTAEELAADAAACVEAGASAIHLHVRDNDGGHTLDASLFERATAAIRAEVGRALVVQVTTEAVGRYRPAEQIALVRALRPEAVSVALRELVPDGTAEQDAAAFYHWAASSGIGVQHIVYSREDVERFLELVERRVIPEPCPHGLFVLGRYSSDGESDPRELTPFVEAWPSDWPWTVCAFGRAEPLCASAAIMFGGHVRVGFENNLWRPDGTLARGNADLVAAVRDLAQAAGRPLATVEDARAVYGC